MKMTLEDGRVVPSLDGVEALSWDASIYFTASEERTGYTRVRMVLSEMDVEQLGREYRDAIKGCFGLFGSAGGKYFKLVETEVVSRGVKK